MSVSIPRIASLLLTIAVGTAGGLWMLRDRANDGPPPPVEVGVSEVAYNPAMADLRLRVTLNGKRGYVDGSGRTVIEPTFAMAMPFSEGLAAVANRNPLNGKTDWQFVNGNGVVVFAHVFVGGQIGTFHEGTAPIQVNGKWGYIDQTGQFAIPVSFDAADDFSQGRAAVRVGAKYGVIDQHGTFVLNPTYDFIGSYKAGFALFAQDNQFGYLDLHGRVAIAPAFDEASDFSEGLAFVRIKQVDHLVGEYIDATGRCVIEPQPMIGGPFCQGLAATLSQGGACFIDRSGRVAITCAGVARFGNFSEGLASAEVNGQNGFIDHSGQMVIKPQWLTVGNFTRGVCRVNSGDVRGYINTAGQYIWKLRL